MTALADRIRWLATARERLIAARSGLLISRYRAGGRHWEGPEGSTIFPVVHMLAIVDPTLAEEQYRGARREPGDELPGFGYAREWPESAREAHRDVDSGGIVPGIEASPSSGASRCWRR